MSTEHPFWTRKEAAHYLQKTLRTIDRWTRAGKLAFVVGLDGKRLYPVQQFSLSGSYWSYYEPDEPEEEEPDEQEPEPEEQERRLRAIDLKAFSEALEREL